MWCFKCKFCKCTKHLFWGFLEDLWSHHLLPPRWYKVRWSVHKTFLELHSKTEFLLKYLETWLVKKTNIRCIHAAHFELFLLDHILHWSMVTLEDEVRQIPAWKETWAVKRETHQGRLSCISIHFQPQRLVWKIRTLKTKKFDNTWCCSPGVLRILTDSSICLDEITFCSLQYIKEKVFKHVFWAYVLNPAASPTTQVSRPSSAAVRRARQIQDGGRAGRSFTRVSLKRPEHVSSWLWPSVTSSGVHRLFEGRGRKYSAFSPPKRAL